MRLAETGATSAGGRSGGGGSTLPAARRPVALGCCDHCCHVYHRNHGCRCLEKLPHHGT